MSPRPEDLAAVDALMAAESAKAPSRSGETAGGDAPPAAPAEGAQAAPSADPQRLLLDIQTQLDQLRGMLGGA